MTSIFGDGIGGAHGGSGLSSIGGSIRLGELLPGAPPIPHALKIELGNWWYYGGSQLNPNTVDNGGRNLCARKHGLRLAFGLGLDFRLFSTRFTKVSDPRSRLSPLPRDTRDTLVVDVTPV